MSTAILSWATALLLVAAPVTAQEEKKPAAAVSACILCHGELDDVLQAPVKTFPRDVHSQVGLGCEDCHGGDASPQVADDVEASMSPAAGYVGKPGRLEIADFCARCHSDADFMKRFDPQGRIDQLAEYRTSVHGKQNAAGDPVPATCTDCHGIHGIRPVSEPDAPVYPSNVPKTCARCHADESKMSAYGLAADQFADYLRSPHADALLDRQDISAPACNDCHGNHGAAPPGVQSVANVCGQCHGREAQLFRASFKKDLFDGMDVYECTVCHGNHRIVHPTPELFRSGSGPRVSAGEIVALDPLVARIGDLQPGEAAVVEWLVTLNPNLDPGDERLEHRVVVTAEGMEPLEIDATVRPGAGLDYPVVRHAASTGMTAGLELQPRPGPPVKPGDAVALTLEVKAAPGATATRVTVQTLPARGVEIVQGSVCLTCHSPGDECDVATEEMYAAISSAETDLRAAERTLLDAEIRGMDVADVQFDLKSRGITAALDSRALIHSFDQQKLIGRSEEARAVATEASLAGEQALGEYQFRRRGLAVSLVLIVLVLVGLGLKIREVDRSGA